MLSSGTTYVRISGGDIRSAGACDEQSGVALVGVFRNLGGGGLLGLTPQPV
jgi:hypothetical protein